MPAIRPELAPKRVKIPHRCPNRREFKAWLTYTLLERGVDLPPLPTYRDFQRGLETVLGGHVGGEP